MGLKLKRVGRDRYPDNLQIRNVSAPQSQDLDSIETLTENCYELNYWGTIGEKKIMSGQFEIVI